MILVPDHAVPEVVDDGASPDTVQDQRRARGKVSLPHAGCPVVQVATVAGRRKIGAAIGLTTSLIAWAMMPSWKTGANEPANVINDNL